MNQQTITYAPEYPPGRPAFFAVKYLRHVLRRGLGYELGSDALCFLMAVALAEDGTGYTKAIQFWNDSLGGLIGLSRERLFAARKKLVERGWLTYFAGARGRAPGYFVTVPGGDTVINSTPLGITAADECVHELGRISRPIPPPIPDSIDHQSPTHSTTPSSLFPDPQNPPPPSRPQRRKEEEASGEFEKGNDPLDPVLLRRLRGAGVTFPEDCLRRSLAVHRERGVAVDQISRVLDFLDTRRVTGESAAWSPFGGGAIYRRLTDAELVTLPAGEGWPRPNADWEREWAREEDRRRRDAARTLAQAEQSTRETARATETARYTQLELQFRAELERLSTDREAVVEILLGGGPMETSLVSVARSKGIDSVTVRRAVLRLLAAAALAG